MHHFIMYCVSFRIYIRNSLLLCMLFLIFVFCRKLFSSPIGSGNRGCTVLFGHYRRFVCNEIIIFARHEESAMTNVAPLRVEQYLLRCCLLGTSLFYREWNPHPFQSLDGLRNASATIHSMG